MDASLKAILEYGVTVVGLVALAALALFFIRDLVKQRDAAQVLATSAVEAFHRLVDQLDIEPITKPARPGQKR